MNATHLLAVEIPIAARLIEMFDARQTPMHGRDYQCVSSRLIESLAFMPTPQLVALTREHADYGPPEIAAPVGRRRLRVLGELAENVAFARLGYLPQAGAIAAAAAQDAANALLARLSTAR
jgi:hypothetical protein